MRGTDSVFAQTHIVSRFSQTVSGQLAINFFNKHGTSSSELPWSKDDLPRLPVTPKSYFVLQNVIAVFESHCRHAAKNLLQHYTTCGKILLTGTRIII